MEDVSKAIELAVGVIIFIIAVTIALILYNSLADTANNVLQINDMQNSITYSKDSLPSDFGYIYNANDIYYLINNLDSNLYSKLKKIIVAKGFYNNDISDDKLKDDNEYNINSINDNKIYNYFTEGSKYKIKYDYEYEENSLSLEENKHKPNTMYIILYEEGE